MNYEVYDNFLDPEIFSNMQDIMLSSDFPWFYNHYIVSKNIKMDDPSMELYNLQFVHTFYRDNGPSSQHFNLVLPILEKMNPLSLLRIKANMGPATSTRIVSGLHTDYPSTIPNLKTAVFYLNDNNGATLFENGEEVASVANRLVVFDNNIKHSGVSCTDTKVRSVINFCYFDNKFS